MTAPHGRRVVTSERALNWNSDGAHRIAVSGTTVVHPAEEMLIAEVLAALAPHSVLVVGGAAGVDTTAARLASAMTHLIYLVAPAADYDIESNRYADIIEYCPPGPPKALAYRHRNQRMIDLSCRLIAFPATANEQRRSGTWMTVRMARVAHLPIDLYPLR